MSFSTHDIRKRFIEYFCNRGHIHLPSSPVIPHDDPSLLFTNAGMNQFKDVFLGSAISEHSRVVTSQKCVRAGGKHNDLENVGHTSRHLTFFEMIGNFSFGEYFKKEAIRFAWEVSTEVFHFPEEKLWPTVFLDDDESFELWKHYVPASRITRLGEKDNFWSMGETGPCGPCSEILFDKGSLYGDASSPAQDPSGERFMEFWNLVFMQYNREVDRTMESLSCPSVDTGAGLERLMALVQGAETVFETDLLRSIIRTIEEISNKKYEGSLISAFRVIADHIRTLCFAIADGAQPSNSDRGYVLRKILRRAVRYGKQLGFTRPFLGRLVQTVIEQMVPPYQELLVSKNRIIEIVTVEEEAFFKTLRHGGDILSKVIERTKGSVLSGDDAFLLKDTYGLPLEEIELIAVDYDLGVDAKRFQQLEEEAKERSKVSRKGVEQIVEKSLFENILSKHGKTSFVRKPSSEGEVLACLKGGVQVECLAQGEEGMVIVDQTSFYGESGGQTGDQGVLQAEGAQFIVKNAIRPFQGIIAHVGRVHSGTIAVGATVCTFIDKERRKKIEANHTATHLLHYALQEAIGEHARQSGSLVTDEYFRFDFCHHKALSREELVRIEDRVNQLIRENHEIAISELTMEEVAKRDDIRQIFGEKYGAVVRVLEAGPSKELCGGCHTRRTGDIGYFRITKESSIAAGIRRIEAVTGEKALLFSRGVDQYIEELASLCTSAPSKLKEKIEKLIQENGQITRECKKLKNERLKILIDGLPHINGVLAGELPLSSKELKMAADEVWKSNNETVLIIGCVDSGRAHLLVRVPQASPLHAGNLLAKGLDILEGKGGGKADFAQGAGVRVEKMKKALNAVVEACNG